MMSPERSPIGLTLGITAKAVSRAFDEVLGAAGGSLPVWLTLLSVKTQKLANQRKIAAGIGIQGATLTHHLNGMEAEGLLVRRRHPTNRRTHQVELTEAGEALFLRLREAAIAFDKRLRAGLGENELAVLDRLLAKLRANIGEQD